MDQINRSFPSTYKQRKLHKLNCQTLVGCAGSCDQSAGSSLDKGSPSPRGSSIDLSQFPIYLTCMLFGIIDTNPFKFKLFPLNVHLK